MDGHYRTAPNSTNRANFSTLGNTNPYTGQPGYIQPDSRPLNSEYAMPSLGASESTYPTTSRTTESYVREIEERNRRETQEREIRAMPARLDAARYNAYTNTSDAQYTGDMNAITFHDRYTNDAKLVLEQTLADLNYEMG